MVVVFDDLEDYLWDIADELYEVYEECLEIPLVGGAIAAAVYPVYFAAWYVAYYFEKVNDWADGIEGTMEWAEDWFDWLYDEITDITDKIKDFLSWADIKTEIEDLYDVVTDSYSTIVAGGKEAILGTYESLDTWHDEQKDKIEDWVVDRFESILDRVFT